MIIPFIKDGHTSSTEELTNSDEMILFLLSVQEKAERNKLERSFVTSKKREIAPTLFDPNTIDSLQFCKIGLPDWLIRRIMNYRRANGTFADAESFGRIYGMPDDIFLKLKPYITISDSFLRPKYGERNKDTLYVNRIKVDSLSRIKYPEGTLVNLNMADTTELKKIPGIGSGIARMLIAYREQLGGFYTLEQLNELDYIGVDLWKWFVIEEPPIPMLEVNKVSIDRLRLHPYLNFYQSKVIVEHRKKRGKIESLSQLSLYEEFTEKDFERLVYYLKFD
ncbi:MAG: ComEA family DNA-binding protein [Phocaeicola sp.]